MDRMESIHTITCSTCSSTLYAHAEYIGKSISNIYGHTLLTSVLGGCKEEVEEQVEEAGTPPASMVFWLCPLVISSCAAVILKFHFIEHFAL